MIWVWTEGASALAVTADETINLTITADETSNVVQALLGVLVGWKLKNQASQPSCNCCNSPHDELTIAVVSYSLT